MRPYLRFLDNALIERIVSEAREILAVLGVEIRNQAALELLAENGARVPTSLSETPPPLSSRPDIAAY